MVALKLLNLDTLFHSVKTDKIVLNDYVITNTEDIEVLKEKLSTIYKSTTISLLPRCECGACEMEVLKGTICPECGTKVQSIYDDTDPFIWFKMVENTEKFISPEFWCMLRTAIGSNIDFLRWISDTQYNPPINSVIGKKIVNTIKIIPGFERSYSWLVKNMKTLLVTLSVTLKKQTLIDVLELFKEQKKFIFSKHIPLQNKRMFILEEVVKNKYTNLTILDVIDVVLYFIKNNNHKSQTKREQVMSRVCSELANVYNDSIRSYLSTKGGIPRKHINGFRSYFTCRAVIVPVVKKHRYDEIEMPWSAFCVMLRPHLLNKLDKRGYSYLKASNLLYSTVTRWHPVVDELINELLTESSHRGIAMIINRNPSLLNGSSQLVYCTHVKRDVSDKTISYPILITAHSNADYDGDELNIQLLVDTYLHDLFIPMRPAASVADMSTPGGVSGRLSLTDPVVATISNYLYLEEQRLKVQR